MHRIHVIDNFITPEDAAVLIEEQLSPSEINPYPDYYKERFGGTAFPYNQRVMDIMVKYGQLSNQTHKELYGFKNPIYVFKGFGSHWMAGTKGDLHLDAQGPEPWIEFSTVIYLNNPSEYDGGIIYFPNQDFSYKPKQYSAVFFPSSGSEHIHGITKVSRGNRHTALFMHTSKPEHRDPEFDLPNEQTRWMALEYPLARL
jgi:hypothetical protein